MTGKELDATISRRAGKGKEGNVFPLGNTRWRAITHHSSSAVFAAMTGTDFEKLHRSDGAVVRPTCYRESRVETKIRGYHARLRATVTEFTLPPSLCVERGSVAVPCHRINYRLRTICISRWNRCLSNSRRTVVTISSYEDVYGENVRQMFPRLEESIFVGREDRFFYLFFFGGGLLFSFHFLFLI